MCACVCVCVFICLFSYICVRCRFVCCVPSTEICFNFFFLWLSGKSWEHGQAINSCQTFWWEFGTCSGIKTEFFCLCLWLCVHEFLPEERCIDHNENQLWPSNRSVSNDSVRFVPLSLVMPFASFCVLFAVHTLSVLFVCHFFLQTQALVVALLASVVAISLGWVKEGMDKHFWQHGALLIASSLFTASIASLALGIVMCGVVYFSYHCRIDPDNVATPIAASLGDITTLALLASSANFLYQHSSSSKLERFKLLMFQFFSMFSCFM